jgi:hypothetical protein
MRGVHKGEDRLHLLPDREPRLSSL